MELKTKVNDKKVFAKIGLAILVCMIVVNVIQTIYYSAINVIRLHVRTTLGKLYSYCN